jgi:hypothetical protein
VTHHQQRDVASKSLPRGPQVHKNDARTPYSTEILNWIFSPAALLGWVPVVIHVGDEPEKDDAGIKAEEA